MLKHWKSLAVAGVLIAALIPLGSRADYSVSQGIGTTIFAFTCFTTKVCPVHTQVDSAGAEKMIPANPASIGTVINEVCTALTVTASSAYTTGNVVGGLVTLTSLLRTGQPTGRLLSVRLTSKSVQTAEFDVSFFAAIPTGTYTDKTAPAITAADLLLTAPPIKMTNNYSGLGTHTVYGADIINRGIKWATINGYALITVVGTPTFGSTSDIQLCATAEQN